MQMDRPPKLSTFIDRSFLPLLLLLLIFGLARQLP